MKFTPVTPNYQGIVSANELRVHFTVNNRSRSASKSSYHVVTNEGKGRRIRRSIAADSDDEGKEADSHDSRIDNYRFGMLATGSSSSNTSTSSGATDAPSGESEADRIDAGAARSITAITMRPRHVASAGVVVSRPCACCRRYNMHLRSHDDCVAWHTRSHGDAGPVRLRSPSEPMPMRAQSRSSAREFNLHGLPEYPVAPSDSDQSPRRSLGLLFMVRIMLVAVAAVAACLLLALPGPLQHLGRPGPQQQQQQPLRLGGAWSGDLQLHRAGNRTSSAVPGPPPPLRREHPPLGREPPVPSDKQNFSLESDSVSLDRAASPPSDLRRSVEGEASHEQLQEMGAAPAEPQRDLTGGPIAGKALHGTVPNSLMEETRAAAENGPSDFVLSAEARPPGRLAPAAASAVSASAVSALFCALSSSATTGRGSPFYFYYYYGEGEEGGEGGGGGKGFDYRMFSYEQPPPPPPPLPLPRSPRELPGLLGATELLLGRGPNPDHDQDPDPDPTRPNSSSSSSSSSLARKAPHKRMKKLTTVTISLVETINGTASNSSDGDGDGDRKKALDVLDYAVFPRGGQVVPPLTLRSATDGEYLTSAEHAPTRPAAWKKIQIPFKIGSVIQPAGAAAARSAGNKALRSHEHLVSHLPASRSSKLCLAGDAGGRVTILFHSPVVATELVLESVIPTSLLRNSSLYSSPLPSGARDGGGLQGRVDGLEGMADPIAADRAIFGATAGRIRVHGWAGDPRMRWLPEAPLHPFHLGDLRFDVDAEGDAAAAAAAQGQRPRARAIDGDAAAVVVSQAFSLAMADASSGEHVPPLRAVSLTVLSNYGNRNCTCLFRVRILGVLF